MSTHPLQVVAEEKVFIVVVRKSTARGTWKSPEQEEKVVDSTVNWAMRGERGRKNERRRKERQERQPTELREFIKTKRAKKACMPQMAELYRNSSERLGEGKVRGIPAKRSL